MFRPSTSESDSEAQVGFLFHVLIGLDSLGEFRAVRGIGRNVAHEEIPEGGRNHSPHLRVGRSKYSECKIEWGMSNRATLFDWIHAVDAGYAYKRQVWVIQLTRDRMPMRIYQLWDAFPISWEGARLDANDNSVDTEEITLAYEAVTMINIPTDFSVGIEWADIAAIVDNWTNTGTDLETDASETSETFEDVELTTAMTDDEKKALAAGDGTSAADFLADTDAEKAAAQKAKDEAEKRKGPELKLTGENATSKETEEFEKIALTTKTDDDDEEDEDEDEEEEEAPKKVGFTSGTYTPEKTDEDAEEASTTISFTTTASSEDEETQDSGSESRPETPKLKMSGGVFFEPTTFGKVEED